MARSSEKAPPGKRRRCSEKHEVKSRRKPTGRQPRGVERGVSGAWRPARDWEAGEAAAAPAFARPRRHARTRLSPTPHFPSVQAARPAGPAPAPTFGDLGFGRSAARRCLRPFASVWGSGIPSLPDPPPRLPPAAFTCSESGWRASRPGPRRRVRDAAPRVRSPFPPPPLRSPARRWAGEQRRPRGRGGCCGVRGGRAASAGRGDTAALCPAGEEQPRSSQPREGGWAAEWGGVSGSREWLPRRSGGSLPSASPHTPYGSPPRPLVRPRVRRGASARPAGPAPETGPAGALSPAPSGERVRAWPILPSDPRLHQHHHQKGPPKSCVSPFPGGAATGRSKPFSKCRVFGEDGRCFELVNVIDQGPQIFAEVNGAGDHGCF